MGGKPLRPPGGRHLAGGGQYPSSGFIGYGTFAECVDECPGRQNASVRMLPAEQGFGADHGTVARAHLRLEMQNELLVRAGAPKLRIELAALFRPCAQGWDVQSG